MMFRSSPNNPAALRSLLPFPFTIKNKAALFHLFLIFQLIINCPFVFGKEAACQIPIAFFGAIVIDSKVFIETPEDFFPVNTTIHLTCLNDFVVFGSSKSVCTETGWRPKLGVCYQLPPSTTTPVYDPSELDLAVATNNENRVVELLDHGADVNQRFPSGGNDQSQTAYRQWDILSDGTVLMLAASSRHHQSMLSLLLKRGANVNARSRFGWSALMWSASNGYVGNMKLLLDRGSDVNARNRRGFTPLMLAAQHGWSEACRLLLDYNADIDAVNWRNWTALLLAVDNGHASVTDLLLRRGADLSKANDGWTALMHASARGYLETAKRLISYRADVNQRSSFDGSTALILASAHGETDVVELLLESGADVNIRDSTGTTALLHAIRNGWVDTAEILIYQGRADVNARDGFGRNALGNAADSFAVTYYRKELMEMLISRGATTEITPTNDDRQTADCRRPGAEDDEEVRCRLKRDEFTQFIHRFSAF